ncbi:hypothetical protein FOZ62_026929 [Perkinsus olseni]|uniref:Uncharacterized protein n=1 Tax=Perkinsus olseni TaxID=32597 RepID=A0A7J6U115_PEROL|nr:hypothetical protein FOZ62_026929 [Perkinsus olseni]
MKDIVKQVITNRQVRAATSKAGDRMFKQEAEILKLVYDPFYRVNMDVVGPYEGKFYAVSLCCFYTGMLLLRGTTHAPNADDVRALIDTVYRQYAIFPKEVTTDNAQCFKAASADSGDTEWEWQDVLDRVCDEINNAVVVKAHGISALDMVVPYVSDDILLGTKKNLPEDKREVWKRYRLANLKASRDSLRVSQQKGETLHFEVRKTLYHCDKLRHRREKIVQDWSKLWQDHNLPSGLPSGRGSRSDGKVHYGKIEPWTGSGEYLVQEYRLGSNGKLSTVDSVGLFLKLSPKDVKKVKVDEATNTLLGEKPDEMAS